jgi:hypothetical protein
MIERCLNLGGQVGYVPGFKSGRSTSRRSIGPRSGALMARAFYSYAAIPHTKTVAAQVAANKSFDSRDIKRSFLEFDLDLAVRCQSNRSGCCFPTTEIRGG